MEGPDSSYSCFEIHICWKVESCCQQSEIFRSSRRKSQPTRKVLQGTNQNFDCQTETSRSKRRLTGLRMNLLLSRRSSKQSPRNWNRPLLKCLDINNSKFDLIVFIFYMSMS